MTLSQTAFPASLFIALEHFLQYIFFSYFCLLKAFSYSMSLPMLIFKSEKICFPVFPFLKIIHLKNLKQLLSLPGNFPNVKISYFPLMLPSQIFQINKYFKILLCIIVCYYLPAFLP